MEITLFDQLDKKQLKELLVKCWMTHDGAWFYNCARELGIEAANNLNKAAIKTLSTIEMNRCFAYNGMKMIGVHKQYECGVIYCISCWLDALGINHTIELEINKFLLNSHEKRSGNSILNL